MPTTVEVYRLEAGNVTGSFLGFGSILDPVIVFVHPPTARPDQPDGPVRPGPLRPGPLRPGPARPGGPIRPTPIHPERRLETVPTSLPAAASRVRCRISSADVTLTLDGTVLAAPKGVATSPTAISLDGAFTGDVDRVTVPTGIGHPTAEEAAQGVLDFLQDAAQNDPPTPSQPPPLEADKGGYRPGPAKRPWYCVICPGAFGC